MATSNRLDPPRTSHARVILKELGRTMIAQYFARVVPSSLRPAWKLVTQWLVQLTDRLSSAVVPTADDAAVFIVVAERA